MPRLLNLHRQESIKIAANLSFDVDATIDTLTCVYCCKIIVRNAAVYCACKTCVYCSQTCKRNDRDHWFPVDSPHETKCAKIAEMSRDIRARTQRLRRFHLGDDFALFDDYGHGKPQFCNDRRELLDKRELLVKELMFEGRRKGGYAGEYTNQNIYAYVIAREQAQDFQLLSKWRDKDNLHATICLLTGRFEELYDMCCPRRKVGRPKNITRSYAKQIDALFDSSLVDMVHIFLIKYMLHMSMENLHQINTNFLDNKDCINLIGEFVGPKKEWIITDNINWYRDQAYEVTSLIHCMDCYNPYDPMGISQHYFEKISSFAQEFFPRKTSAIDRAIDIGKKWIQELKLKRKIDKEMSSTRWDEIITRYEADRKLLYKHKIQPLLKNAVGRINILAGWDAFGSNVHPDLTTVFVTEALTACHEHSFADIFNRQYGDIMLDELEPGYDNNEELFDGYDTENLDEGLLLCIAIEHKLAQCHYHKNKGKEEIIQILNQLPGDSDAYTSDPPLDSPKPDFDIYELVQDKYDIGVVAKWPSDVVRLVAALFQSGLATKDNLDILFGRSGYVSYLIWILQEERAKRTRPRIDSFFTRCRIWKEGCTDNDKRLGLKIKYLNKKDRADMFDKLRKVSPIGNFIRFQEPSVEQFVVRFGLSCLNNNEYLEEFVHDISQARGSCSISKRRRCDLDSFLTAEEACRHYFDSKSLEEAFWDHIGVPRITILNGDAETMKKAGWKYCKNKVLGDKTVKLGNRVAYLYSEDCCSIWKEQAS